MIKGIFRFLSVGKKASVIALKGTYSLGEEIKGEVIITGSEHGPCYIKNIEVYLFTNEWTGTGQKVPKMILKQKEIIEVNQLIEGNQTINIPYSMTISSRHAPSTKIVEIHNFFKASDYKGVCSVLRAVVNVKKGMDFKTEDGFPIIISSSQPEN